MKNAIISALVVYNLQPIWVPGTTLVEKSFANAGLFMIGMIAIWKIENYIKEKRIQRVAARQDPKLKTFNCISLVVYREKWRNVK